VFWRREQLRIPGGLFIVMAVGMTPLATYGFERLVNLWPAGDPGAYRGFHEWVKGGWFAMEVATVLAGAIAIHFFRFPFSGRADSVHVLVHVVGPGAAHLSRRADGQRARCASACRRPGTRPPDRAPHPEPRPLTRARAPRPPDAAPADPSKVVLLWPEQLNGGDLDVTFRSGVLGKLR
jgi:hypothetical protein